MDVYSVTNEQGNKLSKDEVNQILSEIGISDDAIKKGTESAIEADALENNVNLNQVAEEALKTGEVVKGSSDSLKQDYDQQLAVIGIPQNIIDKGDDAVKAYAVQNSISLPPASGTQLNVKF